MTYRYPLTVSHLVQLGVISLMIGGVSCRQSISPGSIQPVVSTASTTPAAQDTPISRIYSTLEQATPVKSPALIALEKAPVSVAGLGPIKIGMTIEDAEKVSEVKFVLAPGSQRESCQYYLPKEMPEGFGLMVIEGRVIRIDIWPGSPIQTPSGIGIGSTEADIQAQYPADHLELAPHAFTQGKYLTFDPAEGGINLYQIVFETDSYGRVTQFRAGQFPAVTWREGCS
jgi:hypothetical protein